MYDIDFSVIKKAKTPGIIFIIVGSIFAIIFGIISATTLMNRFSMDNKTNAIKVEYTTYHDSDGELMYEPTYFYNVDGKEYICDTSSSQSSKPNDNEIIYYQSKNPSKCMPAADEFIGYFFLGFSVLFGGLFILIGIIIIINTNKRIKKVTSLNEVGKLVKGLPYRMERTGTEVNDRPILRPVVDYQLPDGSIVKLNGDGRFDHKTSDEDGLVDLVIDESDPTNYFIDFEINRVGGNNSSDYYNKENKDPYSTTYGTFK